MQSPRVQAILGLRKFSLKRGDSVMERFENGVYDLRSALEFLRGRPGQLAETEVEVDPEAELSGVYLSLIHI